MTHHTLAPVIAGLAAGIGLLVLAGIILQPALPPEVSISSDMIRIDSKQIALDSRIDTNRTSLTAGEQKLVKVALSNQDILKALNDKDEIFILRMDREDSPELRCEAGCARVIISWEKPEKATLVAIVDIGRAEVVHRLFDP